MELNMVKVTSDCLDSGARCVLALRNEPFFFIRCRGVLYMNKGMKNTRKITEAVRLMWQYDFMETQEIMDEVDAAFDSVKQAAGKKAADQLWKAWHEAAQESRQRKAVQAAAAWISDTLDNMTDDDWDELAAAGYDSTFVQHGLFRAFCDLHDKNPDSHRYRDYFKNWAEAAFVYGYQLGKAAAAKEAQGVTV